MSRVGVTLVHGALGSGKTTLLNHVLSQAVDRRIGVLLNDFGDSTIEADLVVARSEGVTTLQNGCICCSLRQDVPQAIMKVLSRGDPEHLWVEASGASDPGALSQLFLELQAFGQLRMDGIVSVADAETFPVGALGKHPTERDRILASDLWILNKVDLVSTGRVDAVLAEVKRRVPHLRAVQARHGQVPPEVILDAPSGPRGPGLPPPSELSDHGFAAVVVDFASPVDLPSLEKAIRALPAAVVRTKGIVQASDGKWWTLHGVGARLSRESYRGRSRAAGQLVAIGQRDALDPEGIRCTLAAAGHGPVPN